MKSNPVNPIKTAARLLVLATVGAHLALLALQNLGLAPVWLAELSRFLPFYWMLLPLGGAVLAAAPLRPGWLLAALCNLLLFGYSTMDWHWTLQPEPAQAGRPLRLLSYNIKALYAAHQVDGFAGIEREVAQHQPDLVALQDAQQWLSTGDSRVPEMARSVFGLPYVMAFDQYVLASRYPLTDCEGGHLGSGDGAGHFLRCSARIGETAVQVVTAHFVSPREGLVAAKTEAHGGVEEWQYNLARRLAQSQTLLAQLVHLPRPLILMGDLNAPEQSVVVENLKHAGLRDAFAEGGRGWGYTHGHALSQGLDLFRIDHILLSADIRVRSAEVGGGEASEHNPVIADVLIAP